VSIESQLENIADKASLHAWVDSLPENARGLVVVEYADTEGEGGWHESKTFGTPQASTLLWLMRSYEHRLMCRNHGERPQDGA
jgi:hypothetical protein